MALRLGMDPENLQPYRELRFEEINTVMQAGIFPSKPIIDSIAWAKITAYYLQNAPDKAKAQPSERPVPTALTGFKPVSLRFEKNRTPLTTLIRFNAQTGDLFVGDAGGILRRFDPQLNLLDSMRTESPPVDLVIGPAGESLLVLIGVMTPNDLATGKIVRLGRGEKLAVQDTLLQNLVRPVGAAMDDLDADGRPDVVVCNHGNYTGSLSWYNQLDIPSQKAAVLKASPGYRKVVVRDLDRDGKPDLVALTGQGSEGISAFYNRGEGRFEEQALLRFPPMYGSSYFQLIDFNGDGYEDILYTNGDNADYSITLKSYHGVRIFLNNGSNSFREAWFFPLHGATQAEARDFDGDGDPDIAAIAYFPDYQGAPEEGFMYFRNDGNLGFIPQTLPNASKGKWLVMETGDFDGDGDADIALGSFLFAPRGVPPALQEAWRREGTSVMVLYNQLKNAKTMCPAQ
jgi:hypothetical protein